MNFSNLENFLSMFTDGKGQIDGKAIKTAYVGRNGVAKKLKKGYIGALNFIQPVLNSNGTLGDSAFAYCNQLNILTYLRMDEEAYNCIKERE